MNVKTGALALVAAMHFSPVVHAGTVDAIQMMRDFTVIALGDLDAGSESEGPVFVGGDMVSNGYTVNSDGLPGGQVGSVSGALIVGGSVTGGTVHLNGGDAVIGGTAGSLNNNGGGSVTLGATIDVAGVTEAFTSLSRDLSALADTGDVTVGGDSNNPTLASSAGGLTVMNVGQSFFSNPNASFNSLTLDPATTLLINVSGTSINMQSNVNIESNNVLINFFEATSLDYSKTFGLNILAPLAHITADVGGSDNFVVGGSIFQRTEFRPNNGQNFTGDLPDPSPVPLPAAGWMLLAGASALLAAARRRPS